MFLVLLLWSWPAYAFTPNAPQVVEVEKVLETKTPLNVEQYTRQYFKDTPVLIQIARCESQFRMWKNGEVLRGVVDPDDTGVMQINKRYHLTESKRLGYDITTLEGSLQYAEYLYNHQGTTPWNASKFCWSQ